MMPQSRFMLLWLIAHCMVSGVISTHFRGGIFMVRPVPGATTQGEVGLSLVQLIILV